MGATASADSASTSHSEMTSSSPGRYRLSRINPLFILGSYNGWAGMPIYYIFIVFQCTGIDTVNYPKYPVFFL